MRLFKLSILDSYLFQELLPTFIFSVTLFSSVGVAIATLSDLSYKIISADLPLIYAVKFFFLKIPEYIAYGLPISILLTTLMTYSRLSKDSELIALYNCGLNIVRVITPAIILSLVVTVITFFFNELIVPNTNYQASSIFVEQLNEPRKYLMRNDIFYPEYIQIKEENGNDSKSLKTLFYAQKFDGDKMQNLTILSTEKNGLNQVIISEKGQWNNQYNAWDLFNVFVYDLNTNPLNLQGTFFEQTQVKFPKTPLELAIKSRDPYDMNIVQSWEYIKLLRLLGDDKAVLMFKVRTAQKISFPFVCIVFALVGSSLGCRPSNSSKATSFGICVAIVFGYYLSSVIISSLGLIGLISPVMAAWIPNIFGFIVGLYLLKKPAIN